MSEKIAVILPVYNKDRVPYFKLSLDSLLNQTYSDLLIYVGVDGPVNDELSRVLKYYEQVEKVKIIWFPENRGLAYVLNDLLDTCFREGFNYIARMDADDISLPERIGKQVAYLESHPDIDVVGGAITEINYKGKLRGKEIFYPEGPSECFEFFSRRNPHAHPAVMFRKSFFDKVTNKYRSSYRQNQDTMLWFDGFKAGTKNANLQEVILKFRITNSFFKKRRNGYKFALKQLKDRLEINNELGYGFFARIFAYMMFLMLISPAWVKKIAYKVFR